MSATLNGLNDLDQIKTAKYGIQTQTFTWGPYSLPDGENTIVNLEGWNTDDQIDKVIILEAVAATQTAGVQVYWTADDFQSDRAQGWTSGFPAGLRMYPTFAVAGKQFLLFVKNNTGAAVSNFQFNYVVTIMALNTFQRMLYGFDPNDADNAAIAKQMAKEADIATKINNAFTAGNKPYSLASTFMHLFANRRINNPVKAVPFKLSIPTGSTSSTPKTIAVTNPSTGTNLVNILLGISLEGAPAINLDISRDGDSNLIHQLNGAAWVQADELPWPFFVASRKYYQIVANGSPGDYYVRLDIDQYKASTLLLAHLDMGPDNTLVDLGML